MSIYCRASQVNILDIWCDITRHFVSHFTAKYFDISPGLSRWILRIFWRTSVSYVDFWSCVSLWIFTILRQSAVSRYFVSRFTANYLEISSGVIRKIISIFCRTSGRTFGYFVVSPTANYLDVLYDASRWITAVFLGRLTVNILDTVGYLKGHFPQRPDGRLPMNYRDILSGTSP